MTGSRSRMQRPIRPWSTGWLQFWMPSWTNASPGEGERDRLFADVREGQDAHGPVAAERHEELKRPSSPARGASASTRATAAREAMALEAGKGERVAAGSGGGRIGREIGTSTP